MSPQRGLRPKGSVSTTKRYRRHWSFSGKPRAGTVKLSKILWFWRRNPSALERIISNLGSVQDAE